MEITNIQISQAVLGTYGTRIMDENMKRKLMKSIKSNDCVQPPVWNAETNHILDGEQRVFAMRELGYQTIQVVKVNLSIEKEKMLHIALNQIKGEWVEDQLASLLKELETIPDFDLDLTGFEKDEVSKLFERVGLNFGEDFFDPAALPTIPDNPITKRGDRIELASHVVFCGDSSLEVDVLALLAALFADVSISDIVYDATFNPANRRTNRERGSGRKAVLLNDSLGDEKHKELLRNYITQLKKVLKPGSAFYLFNGHKNFGKMEDLFTENGFKVSNVITWIKPCPNPGYSDYQNQSEFCLYGWLPGESGHRWFGNNETNVWDISRESVQNLVHPTQKPLALLRRMLLNSSQPGDLVYDGFAGGGSTLIAAHELGRICYSMELDPKYCDVIVKRFAKVFGKSGIKPEVCEKYGL